MCYRDCEACGREFYCEVGLLCSSCSPQSHNSSAERAELVEVIDYGSVVQNNGRMTCRTCRQGFYCQEDQCSSCKTRSSREWSDKKDNNRSELVEVKSKQEFLCLPFENGLTNIFQKGDAVIVVQGNTKEKVYVHKLILTVVEAKPCRESPLPPCPDFLLAGDAQSSRSPVFAKMFDSKMLEEETGLVLINDATLPVIRAMVKFCYDATIDFTDEVTADEVLEVAHKYQIPLLLTICENDMITTLNKENLPKRLKLSRKLEVTGLEVAASKYFKYNFDRVIGNVLVEFC